MRWLLRLLRVAALLFLTSCNGESKTPGGAARSRYNPSAPAGLPAAAEAKAKPPSGPVLDEAHREYLWDCEHHGLLLARRGFPQLSKAIIQMDAAALADRLAPDFTGEVFTEPNEVTSISDDLHAVRLNDDGKPRQPLSRDQFVQKLLDYRQLFKQLPKTSVALMTFSPVVRLEQQGPWKGTAQLRIWGDIEPHQPGEVVLYLQYEVVEPTEESLARPGWMRQCSIVQSLVVKARRSLFKEVAAERGIDAKRFHDNWLGKTTHSASGGVFLCDYNRDGYVDILVTDVNAYALYRGGAGGFTDVTSSMGLPTVPLLVGPASFLATFADLDNDGWEDLILGGSMYRNDAGRRFVDVTRRCNLKSQKDIAGIACADYDRDGRIDLYLVRTGKGKSDSWIDGKSGESHTGNILYRNKGNWQFEDVTQQSNAGGGNRSTFSAAWLDANNDGWPDLHVPNEFGPGLLLINQANGTFQGQLLAEGPSDFGTMGLSAGDFDNDGHIDLYLANMYSKAGTRVFGNVKPGSFPDDIWGKIRHFVIGSQLWHHQGMKDGKAAFRPRAQEFQVAAVGWAYGPAMEDFNNDGFLDIYATAGFISQNRDEPDG